MESIGAELQPQLQPPDQQHLLTHPQSHSHSRSHGHRSTGRHGHGHREKDGERVSFKVKVCAVSIPPVIHVATMRYRSQEVGVHGTKKSTLYLSIELLQYLVEQHSWNRFQVLRERYDRVVSVRHSFFQSI